MLQNWSNGPPSHTPSLGLASDGSGEHTPSSHWFGAVGSPGRPHEPLAHCEPTLHAAPAFAPPWQRLPPHTAPPGQSAFELQASAATVAQVSQKQSWLVWPVAVHFTPLVASVVVPVVAWLNLMASLPTIAALGGGQSKLTSPKKALEPETSQLRPFFGPPLHVPPRTPSRGVGSLTQIGHGCDTVRPLCTAASSWTSAADSPACGPVSAMLAVPVSALVYRLTTQTGTAPDESGSGGP